MKKLVFLPFFIFYFYCFSQTVIEVSPDKWSFMTDIDPFTKEESQVAFILGTSYSPFSNTPILSVNKTDLEGIEVNLTYFPAGIHTILIKFDGDNCIYRFKVNYFTNPVDGYSVRYTLLFHPDYNMSKEDFLDRLKEGQSLQLEAVHHRFIIDVEFLLNGAEETINILQK